jgi:quercetin dioxygenase-like cupin family protein
VSRKDDLAKRNLYEELIELRDDQRARRDDQIRVVKFGDLPWESNPQGTVRWYLHPALDDVAINSLMFYVQEVPPGSRSGKQRLQGGQLVYIWHGRGHSEIDGAVHHWEAGDLINLPLVAEGVVVQHFNDDPKESARLVCAEPNYVHALGVDMGSGLVQIEDAPEFQPGQQ